MRQLLLLLSAVALSACATAGRSSPDAIARLERARAADPQAAPVLRSLGVAYFRAGRYADAQEVLARAHALAPRDGVAALYLGMSAEETGDLAAARAAYSSYLAVGRTKRVRAQLGARLAALSRKELALAARDAVQREGELAGVPGSPRTVAVLPLRFAGSDSSLAPLQRGLADLLVTDLARSAQLTVVERARVQALLDELARVDSGAVDSTTAARAGRMVRAGRLVQGAITQLDTDQLRVDAAVVDVPTAAAVSAVQGDDRLEQLFTLEKRIAFGLFDALGVTLTPAERALVEQRPTRSLAAFLAYSRGLEAEDRGDFDAAAQRFLEARRADPSFAPAARHAERAQAAAAGGAVTPASIQAQLAGTAEGAVVATATQGLAAPDAGTLSATLLSTASGVNASPIADATSVVAPPPQRDPGSSATSTDNLTATHTSIIVTVTIPGTQP